MRILVHLALHNTGKPARTRQIAEAEGLSPDYAEQILAKLRTAGLVKSRRGARGGFLLDGDPSAITVGDVLAAIDGPLAIIGCLSEDCSRATFCPTRPVWQKANDALKKVFSDATIASMAEEAGASQSGKALSFEI